MRIAYSASLVRLIVIVTEGVWSQLIPVLLFRICYLPSRGLAQSFFMPDIRVKSHISVYITCLPFTTSRHLDPPKISSLMDAIWKLARSARCFWKTGVLVAYYGISGFLFSELIIVGTFHILYLLIPSD
jgi:hypothetical protein